MRKIILTLMMLLIITPTLACAMVLCPMQSNTETSVNKESNATPFHKPCHNMMGMEAKGRSTTQNKLQKGIMLGLDCMNVDLFHQTAQQDVIKAPDQILALDAFWNNVTPPVTFLIEDTPLGRGPPIHENPHLAMRQQSLYLSTSRLRI